MTTTAPRTDAPRLTRAQTDYMALTVPEDLDVSYGHAYPGVDPRDFKLDTQVNTPEEIAAHAEALAKAEAGERWDEPTGGLHPPESGLRWHTVGEWGWGIITHPVEAEATRPVDERGDR
jgi:hypothetical protein